MVKANIESLSLVATTVCLGLVTLASAQDVDLSYFPGAQTTAGVLAASTDGLSRYLAPDGPIQPGITMIGGLPMRGVELANNGITSISSGLQSGAKSMARAAGQSDASMPGMQALGSVMPAQMGQLGNMMQSAIRSKNNFIRGQAESGIQAGNRLGQMMRNGLSVRRSASPATVAASATAADELDNSDLSADSTMMMGSMGDAMMKGKSKLEDHLKQSMSGHMSRMQSMHGMGGQMRDQAQQIGQTMTEGLTGAMEHLHRTGEKIVGQLQSGHQKNTQAMSGIFDSMQDSIGKLGKNMGGNMGDMFGQVQSAAQQVHEHLQKAASGPLNALQSLGSSFGSMMHSGKGGSSSGGRY